LTINGNKFEIVCRFGKIISSRNIWEYLDENVFDVLFF
jgi:hypothetical protein